MKWEEWDKQQAGSARSGNTEIDIDRFWQRLEPHVEQINIARSASSLWRKNFWRFLNLSVGAIVLIGYFWIGRTIDGNVPVAAIDSALEEAINDLRINENQKELYGKKEAIIQEQTGLTEIDQLKLVEKKVSGTRIAPDENRTATKAKSAITAKEDLHERNKIIINDTSIPRNLQKEENFTTSQITEINLQEPIEENKLRERKRLLETVSLPLLRPKLLPINPALPNLFSFSRYPEEGRVKYNWRLSTHFHGGLVQKKYIALNEFGEENQLYRKETEQARFFSQQEVKLQFNTTKHFYFSVGYSRTTIREQLLFENNPISEINDYSIRKNTLVYDPGSVVYNTENGLVENGQLISDKIFNQYTFVDCSLTLGYENRWKRFLYHAYAGVYFNAKVKGEGAIYVSPNRLGNLGAGTYLTGPSVLPSRTGLSPYLGIELAYPLVQRLNIILGIQHRFGPSKILKNERTDIANHSLSLSSLQVGLSYEFEVR